MKVICSAGLLATIAWLPYVDAEGRSLRGLESEKSVNQHFAFQSRIVGGSIANAKQYEFSVNLGGCGGSLIYEDIILTANHCALLSPEVVRIGGSNKNNGVRKDIVGSMPHPLYDSVSQDYDFLIYKLTSPVVGYKPVTLNTVSSKPSNMETLTVIGFGSIYEDGPSSFYLREVDVSHVPQEVCNSNSAYMGQIDEAIEFCAGVTGGGRDSCQGDSGSPILDQNGVQVGVTSWGNGCAQDDFPGVYARVSAVSDWIQESICAMSSNPPATCGDIAANGNENSNAPDTGNENSNASDIPGLDLIQPKGISLRVEINFDAYPSENAWGLYNEDTMEQLHWSNFGDLTKPGVLSMTFSDLANGNYAFLFLDNFNDGICCEHGNGYVKVYEVFSDDRPEELRFSHDGRFENALGAEFSVLETRSLGLSGVTYIDNDHKARADRSSSPDLSNLP